MKKTVVSILSALAGVAFGAGAVGKMSVSKIQEKQAMSDKHLELFKMMCQWVKVKQDGKSLVSYFERNGYKKIAIYGMSYAGEVLVGELDGSGVMVAYGIDRNADSIYAGFDIITMEDSFEPVDAVVVTAIVFFEEIKGQLSEKMDCPVISLEDILYGV